jgi:hypothetical protein
MAGLGKQMRGNGIAKIQNRKGFAEGSEPTEKKIKIKGTTDATINALKKAFLLASPIGVGKEIAEYVKDRTGKKKGGMIKKADMLTAKMSMNKKGKMMKGKR